MDLSVQALGVGVLNWRVKQQLLYRAPGGTKYRCLDSEYYITFSFVNLASCSKISTTSDLSCVYINILSVSLYPLRKSTEEIRNNWAGSTACAACTVISDFFTGLSLLTASEVK